MTRDVDLDATQSANGEGWFTDPWGLHDARWISEGQATDLVRDGDIESRDAPPATPPTVAPTRILVEPGNQFGADLRRADEAEDKALYPNALRQHLVDAGEEGIDSGSG